MVEARTGRWRKIKVIVLVLVLLAGVGAFGGWYKFFREEPQPEWITADPHMRFKYGSIGAEHDAGVPYWIWYVLPRMFPEKLPGPGGYTSLGVLWEEGQELPIGFTKKVIGFPRVANTCASCHTASYRFKAGENPTFIPTGPNHTLNLEAFFRFMIDCAKDPRFNPDNMMREINLAADLSWLDRIIYRFILIPITKKRLLEREAQFAWIYRKDFPEWGRGRDDAMNLTKYFMIKFPMDNTIGPTDMPSLWNLKKYKPEKGHFMNFAGDSHDPRSVIIDSALGVLGAAPHNKDEFLDHIKWFEDYLGSYPAPKYPFPIDRQKVATGKSLFDKTCARCHASDRPARAFRWRRSARTGGGWRPGASRRRSRPIRLSQTWASSERASSKKTHAATSLRSSTVSGSTRRTCTTALCRPCAICWNRSRIGQNFSIAAMMFTTR